MYLNQKDFTEGYYLVPEDFSKDSAKKAWVVVEVHGAGGLKGEGRGGWISEALSHTPIIVLVPSFTNGYQGGDRHWAKQLIENFQEIQSLYPVHDRMFVHGHSGGAQFVHRFAFNHPELVAGVSAHSAGSWAVDGGYGRINPEAKAFPWLISCGDQDTKVAWKGYTLNRIDWYKRFAAELEKQGFVVHGSVWPGVGHGVKKELYLEDFVECFRLATEGRLPERKGWAGDIESLAKRNR